MRKFIAATAVAAAAVVGGGAAFAASDGVSGGAVSRPSAASTTTVPSTAPDRPRGRRHGYVKGVLDDLVKQGTITQAQEDAILDALKEKAASFEGERGPRGFGRGFGVLRDGMDAVAGALGITPEQLRDELKDGKSIAEVAKAHNVDIAAVTKALTDKANERIDKAVADGHLTESQATKLRERLDDMVSRMLDGSRGRGHDGAHEAPPTTN